MSDDSATPRDWPIEIAIPEGKVIFLLGAGASKDAGFPLVDGLTHELKKALPYLTDINGKTRDEFPKLFDAVVARDPKAEKNYEHFFACLELMTPGPEKPSRNLISFNLEEHLLQAVPDLACSIAKPIVEELRKCHLDYQPGYLAKLGDFAPKEGRLKVFTLNYDLCVEKAFRGQDIDLTTGFCRATGRWAPELFDTTERGINLYKMHGSLNWTYDDNLEDQRLIETYSSSLEKRPTWGRGPDLVLGPENKLQSDDPYVTLYYQFHRALWQAQVCVAVGFSYGDRHMTTPLLQAMQRGLTLVDVRPDAIGQPGHCSIRSKAKEAFENCEIWNAVQNCL